MMRTWRTSEYYLKLKSVKTYLKRPAIKVWRSHHTHPVYSHTSHIAIIPLLHSAQLLLVAMCVHFDARHNLEARHDGNAVLFCWVLFTAIHMARSCMHHNSKVSKIYQRSCQPSVHKSLVKIMTFLTPTSLHQRGTYCGQKLMDDIVV